MSHCGLGPVGLSLELIYNNRKKYDVVTHLIGHKVVGLALVNVIIKFRCIHSHKIYENMRMIFLVHYENDLLLIIYENDSQGYVSTFIYDL